MMIKRGDMMTVFRNFFRHIRDGFRNLFRNGWMTMGSIFVMALTLFMMGGLTLLFANVQKITHDIESSIQIRVMIDAAANETDEANLQAGIDQLDHVVSTTYRTKDEELQDLIENVGEEFNLYEGDSNPLLNVIVVDVDNVDNIKQVAQTIDQMTYVSQTNYGELTAENLFKQIDLVRYVLAVIAAILIVVAVLLVSNTIRLTIFARQTEIEIMRLVGAKKGFIQAPFALEGGLIGLIGAVIATGLLYVTYQSIQMIPGQVYGIMNIRFIENLPMFYWLGGGLVILGILLGNYGARRSIKQFLLK